MAQPGEPAPGVLFAQCPRISAILKCRRRRREPHYKEGTYFYWTLTACQEPCWVLSLLRNLQWPINQELLSAFLLKRKLRPRSTEKSVVLPQLLTWSVVIEDSWVRLPEGGEVTCQP